MYNVLMIKSGCLDLCNMMDVLKNVKAFLISCKINLQVLKNICTNKTVL